MSDPTQTGQTSSADDLFEKLSSGQKKLADAKLESGRGKSLRGTGGRIIKNRPAQNDLKSQESCREEKHVLDNKKTELAKIFERIQEKKKEQEKRRKIKVEKEKNEEKNNEKEENEEKNTKEIELNIKEKERKERTEVDKNEKVSFLKAMFERKGGHNLTQKEKQTPPRRRIRRKAELDVDFKYQKTIDTFLVRKEKEETGNPSKAKRKWEENDQSTIGTLLTPSKRSRK